MLTIKLNDTSLHLVQNTKPICGYDILRRQTTSSTLASFFWVWWHSGIIVHILCFSICVSNTTLSYCMNTECSPEYGPEWTVLRLLSAYVPTVQKRSKKPWGLMGACCLLTWKHFQQWGAVVGSLRDVIEVGQDPMAIRCFRCRGQGHLAQECCKEMRCFACIESGHMRSDGPTKRGRQPASWGRGKKGHLNWKGVEVRP